MTRIQLAHHHTQGISFAVFDADARSGSASDREELLASLTHRARLGGLRVDKSALAFSRCGRLQFFGAPDLVRFLATGNVRLVWNREIAA